MQRLFEENKQKLVELCRQFDVEKMYVFGSASTYQLQEESDIDILISFKNGISIERYTDNYFGIHYKLEELFNRKVDLITENSLSNPYFKKSIEDTKQLLYAV